MPMYVVQKTAEALNEKEKSIKGAEILILGISYKKNVDDMRESPSVELIKLYKSKGAKVDYSDPYFAKIPESRNHELKLESVPINRKTIEKYDAVVLATDHDSFDYELIEKYSNTLIDTRGRFEPGDKTIRA